MTYSILPPVFVMNPYYTGIGIARNLHAHGVEVYGLSSEADAPGIWSRFFKGIYRVPNGRDEPEALFQRMIHLRQYHKVAPVVFPTRDFDVLFLHNHGEALGTQYRFPRNNAIECILDKLELFRIASSHGIPVPRTVVCSSMEQIEAETATLHFPLVVKPRSAHQWRRREAWEAVGSRKAFLVESLDVLRVEYNRIASAAPEVMIQEYVRGSDCDIAVCCCFMDANRELSTYFTARKLRQDPPLFGTGCAVETDNIPEIVPLARDLLQACRYTGLAEVEFKRDSSSGKWYLIEVNPRHWDQHELGAHVGVNLSWIAYQELIGRTPLPHIPVHGPAAQFKWIAETEAMMLILRNAYVQIQENRKDFVSFKKRFGRHYCVARSVAAEILFLLKGRKVFAIFHRSDPIPGILLCFRAVRGVFHIAGRHAIGAWRARQLIKQKI
jgi:D-aspartate ligase